MRLVLIHRLGCLLWLALTCCLATVGQAHADVPFEPIMRQWSAILDAAEAQTAQGALPNYQAAQLEDTVHHMLDAGWALQSQIEAHRNHLAHQASLLAQADPSVSTLPALEQRRKDIAGEMQRVDALLLDIRILRARAEDVIRLIGEQQQLSLEQEMLRPTPAPFELATWRVAAEQAVELLADIRDELASYPASDALRDLLHRRASQALIGLLILVAIGAMVRRLMLRRVREPTHPHSRYLMALPVILPVLISAVCGMLVIRGILRQDLLNDAPVHALVPAVLKGVAIFVVLAALVRAALATDRPAWCLLPLPPETAAALAYRIRWFAAVAAVSSTLITIINADQPPKSDLLAVFALLDTSLRAALGISLLAPRFWALQSATPSSLRQRLFRAVLCVVFLAPPILTLLWHEELAVEVAFRSYGIITLLVSVAITRLALLGAAEMLLGSKADETDSSNPAGPAASRSSLFCFGVVLDLALLGLVTYLFLLLFNVSPGLIHVWVTLAFEGFSVGGVNISLGSVITAIVTVAAVLIVLRLVVRLITQRLMAGSGMDVGLLDAIATSLRYVSIVVAVIVGLSMIGVSLSSLLLFASALSVGIGLGLRPVVENLVAGFLLLIERPIRAGDWIVVGHHEGIVRRISARSTEVEGFDKATVIVPNSELISRAVVNWTHSDRVARISIKVTVPTGVRLDTVREALLACANAHPMVLATPPAVALLTEFGDDTLTFELQCFVADAAQHATVRSDLHIAIDDKFHALDIRRAQRGTSERSAADNETDATYAIVES
jgi:small-conductance mechanosensitive channel